MQAGRKEKQTNTGLYKKKTVKRDAGKAVDRTRVVSRKGVAPLVRTSDAHIASTGSLEWWPGHSACPAVCSALGSTSQWEEDTQYRVPECAAEESYSCD